MSRKEIKKTPIQILDDRLQLLLARRLQAYNSGASSQIIQQIENKISETQLDLYTEIELDRHRNSKDDDGESFIV